MMYFNSLGKAYKGTIDPAIKNTKMDQDDRMALRRAKEKLRSERLAKIDARDEIRDIAPKREINKLEKDKESYIQKLIKEKKEMANHLARKYGLKESNNPEALLHDRLHCYICDMKLHIPNAYKELPEETQVLFGRDEDVRHLCCFCFAKMENDEIVQLQCGEEADSNIRMAIYDPESTIGDDVKKIEKMTADRRKYIESKIKRYEGTLSLIGKSKHNDLDDEMENERTFLSGFSTRYNYACN